MNKYVIPICDIQSSVVYNEVIMAHSLTDCQDKLMQKILSEYSLEDTGDYKDFVDAADAEDILIGPITDVEAL